MRHEDIREHLVIGALWAITHAQPGREKDPFAEVFWWEESVIAGVLRLVRGLIRRGLQCAETNNDCCDYRRHSPHGCSTDNVAKTIRKLPVGRSVSANTSV